MNKDKKELNNNEVKKVSGGNCKKHTYDELRPWGTHPLMKYGGPLLFKKKWAHEQREKGVKIAENLKKMHEDLMDGKFGSKKELSNNEVENVSGGTNNEQQFAKGFDPNNIDKGFLHMAYGGPNPRRRFEKILEKIKKEKNKEKNEID